MPLITSFPLMRPNLRLIPSPAIPHQFALIARRVVGCAMIAGVHSTVWIFAISAEFTSRARS
jgi:hypothetical protein